MNSLLENSLLESSPAIILIRVLPSASPAVFCPNKAKGTDSDAATCQLVHACSQRTIKKGVEVLVVDSRLFCQRTASDKFCQVMPPRPYPPASCCLV